MDKYIARRQLRWLGHVSRMPFDRLPRRLLSSSSWLPYKRPRGALEMTVGKTIIKALKTFDIVSKHWPAMAANRTNWRHRINKCEWYISPKACQYPVSTRINRMETLFPCPPFLLFVLCLLSRSSWNLCSNWSWSNYIYIYIIIIFLFIYYYIYIYIIYIILLYHYYILLYYIRLGTTTRCGLCR